MGIEFENRIQVVICTTWEGKLYVYGAEEEWTNTAAEGEIPLPFLCIYLPVIADSPDYLRVQSRRCNVEWGGRVLVLTSPITPNVPSS